MCKPTIVYSAAYVATYKEHIRSAGVRVSENPAGPSDMSTSRAELRGAPKHRPMHEPQTKISVHNSRFRVGTGPRLFKWIRYIERRIDINMHDRSKVSAEAMIEAIKTYTTYLVTATKTYTT
jgi:hypothetical protein